MAHIATTTASGVKDGSRLSIYINPNRQW